MFMLLYVVCYPVVLLIAMAFRDEHGSIGDYLVGPYFSAFLWAFVPAILFSIIIDVYKKSKKAQADEQAMEPVEEADLSLSLKSLKQDEKPQVKLGESHEASKSAETSKE